MTNKNEELLADMLMRWEELLENGQDVSIAELGKEHPQLVEELGRRIQALKSTSWLDRPLNDEGNNNRTDGHVTSRTFNDRYRLDKLIAVGGFAEVWHGFDLELHRTVAVKIPKATSIQSGETFLAEARYVAQLKHPGIVPVYDLGHDQGMCFIVSEFIEGGSLGDLLAITSPSHKQAILWMVEIADALEFAHRHGLIHRDIKPANILIDHLNHALLADFGIAQAANNAGSMPTSFGTLRYMSPEQLEGKDADLRADIFSLGIVLHEVLTGKLPYSSGEPNALRHEILTGPANNVSAEIPEGLREICQMAVQRKPENRYSTTAEFSLALRGYLSAPSSNRKNWYLLTSIALTGIGLAFVCAMWKPSSVEQIRNRRSESESSKVSLGNELSRPAEFASTSTGMRFALIPAGSFQMGSPDREPGRKPDEGPQHTVELTRPFYLGIYEVTQDEYRQLMGINPSTRKPPEGQSETQYPVDNVTWFDAIEFCNKQSIRDGRIPYYEMAEIARLKSKTGSAGAITFAAITVVGGAGYRLPTEAEWEYACRAGTTTPFHFGSVLNGSNANAEGNMPYGTSESGPSFQRPTTVGKYPSNAFGLFDMHGNTWEWCEDSYDSEAYSRRKGTVVNPIISTESPLRSMRGGSCVVRCRDVRSAFRYGIIPANLDGNFIGFRVACFVSADAYQ